MCLTLTIRTGTLPPSTPEIFEPLFLKALDKVKSQALMPEA